MRFDFNFLPLTKMSALNWRRSPGAQPQPKTDFYRALGHNLSSTITIQRERSPARDRAHTVQYLPSMNRATRGTLW